MIASKAINHTDFRLTRLAQHKSVALATRHNKLFSKPLFAEIDTAGIVSILEIAESELPAVIEPKCKQRVRLLLGVEPVEHGMSKACSALAKPECIAALVCDDDFLGCRPNSLIPVSQRAVPAVAPRVSGPSCVNKEK